MTRRAQPLVADALEQLPERCRRCLFWELGAPRPAEDAPADQVHAQHVRKQAWVTSCELEDGPPGTILRQDGRVVGWALHAPARSFAPRGPLLPSVDPDALLLATAWLHPDVRAGGLGRVLLQAVLRDAIARDLPAVQAYGDRRAREWDCVLPATWLLHEGFEVAAEHPRYPLLRLETRRTLRWAASLEHAAHELLGRVTPRPVPESPAP